MRLTPLLIVLLFACSNPVVITIPPAVLSVDEMVTVLADVHFLKGQVAVLRIKNRISKAQEDSLFQELYTQHQISEDILDRSLSFYTKKSPSQLEKIYTNVVEELQKKEADLQD
jgi:hypothetical protein